jgi:hypothetical protein
MDIFECQRLFMSHRLAIFSGILPGSHMGKLIIVSQGLSFTCLILFPKMTAA